MRVGVSSESVHGVRVSVGESRHGMSGHGVRVDVG